MHEMMFETMYDNVACNNSAASRAPSALPGFVFAYSGPPDVRLRKTHSFGFAFRKHFCLVCMVRRRRVRTLPVRKHRQSARPHFAKFDAKNPAITRTRYLFSIWCLRVGQHAETTQQTGAAPNGDVNTSPAYAMHIAPRNVTRTKAAFGVSNGP